MRNIRLVFLFLIVATLAAPAAAQNDRKAEAALQSAMNKQFVDDNLEAAIKQYKEVAASYSSNHRIAAAALVRLGQAYEKLGNQEAQKAYERIVHNYGDQPAAAAEAQSRLKALVGLGLPSDTRKGATKLTTGSFWESVTADGRYLLSGNMIRDLAAGEDKEIVSVREDASASILSPDGKYVAYTSLNDQNVWEVHMSPIAFSGGVQSRVLLHKEEFGYSEPFGWSPDGKEVFAILERKDYSVLIGAITAANGSLRIIKNLEQRYPNRPSLSPDGRYIVYDAPVSRESPRNLDVFVLAVGTAQETAVVEDPSWDEMPVWTPDGKAIVFKSNRSGSLALWLLRITDGKKQGTPEQLRPNIPDHQSMGFARDGSYYFTTGGGQNIDVSTAVIDLDAGTVSEMTAMERFSGRNSSPVYSPDGQKLAYLSQRSVGRFRSLVIRMLKTGEEREIPTDDSFGAMESFAWFPDGQSILLSAPVPHGVRSFHRVDLNSGEIQLLKEGINGTFPAVSPDGKTIFYMKNVRPDERRIMSYNLETQREAQIFEGNISLRTANGIVGVMSAHFALSPDGRQIAFALIEKRPPTLTDPEARDTDPPVLVVMPSSGGPVQKLRTPETLGLATVQWAPDGKSVLVQRGSGQLFWVPIDGGEPRRIGTGTFPAVSSMRLDGKEIAVTTRSAGPAREVWVDPDLLPPSVATPSKDGEDENAGVYVASLDPVTGKILAGATPLSERSAGRTCAPAWSPDGQYVSFNRRSSAAPSRNDRDFDWVIRSVESGQERVFPINSTDCWVTAVWFHDSNSLLTQSFVEARDRGRLRRRNLSTGELQRVNVPAYETANALSPDDRTLYMTVPDPKTSIISIVSVVLATGQQNRIWSSPTPSGTEAAVPARLALSPDGRTFALVLTDSKKVRLVRVGTDGTGFREVYSADVARGVMPSLSGLAWMRDGRSILFMEEGKSEQRLMRVSAEGGKPEFTGLTIGNTINAVFDISPDGRKILFFSPRLPSISGPAGGNSRQ